jgi:hypothetical protein
MELSYPPTPDPLDAIEEAAARLGPASHEAIARRIEAHERAIAVLKALLPPGAIRFVQFPPTPAVEVPDCWGDTIERAVAEARTTAPAPRPRPIDDAIAEVKELIRAKGAMTRDELRYALPLDRHDLDEALKSEDLRLLPSGRYSLAPAPGSKETVADVIVRLLKRYGALSFHDITRMTAFSEEQIRHALGDHGRFAARADGRWCLVEKA